MARRKTTMSLDERAALPIAEENPGIEYLRLNRQEILRAGDQLSDQALPGRRGSDLGSRARKRRDRHHGNLRKGPRQRRIE